MKSRFAAVLVFLALFGFAAGCASKPTEFGKRRVSVLGGLVETETQSYQEPGPLTPAVKSSEVDPGAELTGDRVSLFWGLFTYIDI